LRGSGRFRQSPCGCGGARRVSIPFIAGQWSLRRRRPPLRSSSERFNPLHCGAVVASVPEQRIFHPLVWGFNPLHCGAVVASGRMAVVVRDAHVSIPFIAGQWSLHPDQTPLDEAAFLVSIPFIAGQWSLPGYDHPDPEGSG